MCTPPLSTEYFLCVFSVFLLKKFIFGSIQPFITQINSFIHKTGNDVTADYTPQLRRICSKNADERWRLTWKKKKTNVLQKKIAINCMRIYRFTSFCIGLGYYIYARVCNCMHDWYCGTYLHICVLPLLIC